MKNKVDLNRKIIYVILVYAVIGLYCLACGYFQDLYLIQTALFVVFETIVVYGFGLAVVRILKLDFTNKIEEIGTAYVVGYGMNILAYMLLFPIFGRIMFVVIMWCLGVGSIIYLYLNKENKSRYQTMKCDWIIVLFFGIIILGLQFFVFAANNMSCIHIGGNTYYTDLFYWSSDAVSLTYNFPPINFRDIHANTYYYHYFTSIQLAVVSMCTGINVFSVACGFSFIQSAIFLIFGSYIFFNTIFKNKGFVFLGMSFLLCVSGNETITWTTPVSHMYTAPFGYDISLVMGLMAVSYIYKQIKVASFNWKLFLMTIFLFSLCLGSKGPMGVSVLLILGIVCIYWLISYRKNGTKLSLGYGLTLLVLFFAIYILIINGISSGTTAIEKYTTDNNAVSILESEELNALLVFLVESFSDFGGQIIFLIIYTLLVNPAVYILFYAACVKRIIKKTVYDILDIACICVVIMGVLFTRCLSMIGSSQIYFIMATFPYALTFALRSFEDLIYPEKHNKYQNKKTLIKFGVFCGCLLVLGGSQVTNSMYFRPQLVSGWNKIQLDLGNATTRDICLTRDSKSKKIIHQKIEMAKQNDYYYAVIEHPVYVGCKWIAENTSSDCLIATNLDVSGYHYRLAVIAERFPWARDIKIIDRAARGNGDAIDILIAEGVDYLFISTDNRIYWDSASILYENKEVMVIGLENYRNSFEVSKELEETEELKKTKESTIELETLDSIKLNNNTKKIKKEEHSNE